MSKTTVDDVNRAATQQSGKAVSLLARVILPRPGEPLDVRKLYLEESATNARRAHATDRTRCRSAPSPRCRSPLTSTRSRRATGGGGRRCGSVVLRAELTGKGRVDVYRTKATGARIFVRGRNFAAKGSGRSPGVPDRSRAIRGRRMDLVRHHHRQRRDIAQRGLVPTEPAPGVANIAVGIPTFNRPATASTRCVNLPQIRWWTR